MYGTIAECRTFLGDIPDSIATDAQLTLYLEFGTSEINMYLGQTSDVSDANYLPLIKKIVYELVAFAVEENKSTFRDIADTEKGTMNYEANSVKRSHMELTDKQIKLLNRIRPNINMTSVFVSLDDNNYGDVVTYY